MTRSRLHQFHEAVGWVLPLFLVAVLGWIGVVFYLHFYGPNTRPSNSPRQALQYGLLQQQTTVVKVEHLGYDQCQELHQTKVVFHDGKSLVLSTPVEKEKAGYEHIWANVDEIHPGEYTFEYAKMESKNVPAGCPTSEFYRLSKYTHHPSNANWNPQITHQR
jgi:hypothetical protein